MQPRLKIFFDGGSRPNPGSMEIAVVAAGRSIVVRDLGQGTSSDAEWLALCHALTIALSLDVPDFVLLGDAADVIGKANGLVRCRKAEAETEHLARFHALSAGRRPRIRHIGRSQNLAGIALARLHPR